MGMDLGDKTDAHETDAHETEAQNTCPAPETSTHFIQLY